MAIDTADPRVATMASQGLVDPTKLSPDEIRAVCASALMKLPDHRQDEIVKARPYEEQIAIALATARFSDLPDGDQAAA
jgi:hypothetical protein